MRIGKVVSNVLWVGLVIVLGSPQALLYARERTAPIEQLRVLESDDVLEVKVPVGGLAFPPHANTLLQLERTGVRGVTIRVIDAQGSEQTALSVADPLNVVVTGDPESTQQVFVFGAGAGEQVRLEHDDEDWPRRGQRNRFTTSSFGAFEPSGGHL